MIMNNDKLSGIKIFGVMNIVLSSFFLIAYSLFFFVMDVLMGGVTDEKIYGFLDWFNLYIIGRVSLSIFFIFVFLLFKSGLLLLRQDIRARKLAVVASSAIVLSQALAFLSTFLGLVVGKSVKLDFLNFNSIIWILFLFYAILQIVYFMSPGIKSMFNDVEVKINLKIPIIIIIILFFSPLLIRPIIVFILNMIRQPL